MSEDDDQAAAQARRWRAPPLVASLAGFALALVTGCLLLFFGNLLDERVYWGLAHWLTAMLALLPYAVYQYRHWRRVRRHAQQTHYRVGLHAFFTTVGTLATGLVLLLPTLARESTAWLVADLAHMFFGFVFVMLLSAHLTLVALVSVSRAGERVADSRRAIRFALVAAAVVTASLVLLLVVLP
jgi:hypothetical protein